MSRESEQDRLLDHEYDGIQEYDNPMPRWWLATFWVTILFSILYALNVPYIGNGKGRIADYEADMAEAAKLAAANDPLAGMTSAKVLAASTDATTHALGKATFTQMCTPCHGPDGGGVIGPNLTDNYYIHGGRPIDLMRTIVEGVAAKGMPAWGKILKPDQLLAVAGYVVSLRGTTPAKPKAPEGTPLDTTAVQADTGAAR